MQWKPCILLKILLKHNFVSSYQVSISIHGHSERSHAHEEPVIIVVNHPLVLLPDDPPLHVVLRDNTKHITERLGWIRACMYACVFSDVVSVSPVHRRLCRGCSSRSPTQSGRPHLSLKPHAVGCTAGQRAERLSAGGRPAALKGQEHHSGVTPFVCTYA